MCVTNYVCTCFVVVVWVSGDRQCEDSAGICRRRKGGEIIQNGPNENL